MNWTKRTEITLYSARFDNLTSLGFDTEMLWWHFENAVRREAGLCRQETIKRRNCDINSVSCSVERRSRWERRGAGTADARRVWLSALTDWHVIKTDRQRGREFSEVWRIFSGRKCWRRRLFMPDRGTHTSAQCVSVCVWLWLLLIQSLSREAEGGVCVCVLCTHRVPAPVCSWVSGCCGCAGIAPSVGGLSHRSGWDARPVCSGSRTRHRIPLCDTPTWDSWHSPRRSRQIWQEETDE